MLAGAAGAAAVATLELGGLMGVLAGTLVALVGLGAVDAYRRERLRQERRRAAEAEAPVAREEPVESDEASREG
ncbi:MAG: hypothetical protein IT371_31210 [Deltaproteobacteria bacterium]|nr:hypothetical protein [Deltaproteobacteria bacterium]